MEQVNLFGKGFIGSRYCELNPNTLVNSRDDYEVKTKNVLYFISTVDNYNVFTDPFLDIETNLNVLVKVLQTCKDKDIVFNFVSSWFVYGNTKLPAREDAHCDPKGFYSITKLAAEQLLVSYCETFGFKYRIIRMGNVLGCTDSKVSKKKNALQYMINNIKAGLDVSLYDAGNVFRDYIYVDDAIAAIQLILEKGNTNEIFNVGNGIPVYIGDAIEYVIWKLNSKSKTESVEPSDFHKIVQVKNMVLNIDKIKSLGYVPKYNIHKILDILMES